MPKAIWNGQVIAESDDTIVVEGNHYFPPDSLDPQFFRDSNHTSICGWKGTAQYKDIVVNGETNPAATWSYPTPKRAARKVAGYYAFWHGVQIQS